ncbi:hypothetical protein BZB76_1836 [Actinomadura pelletieri DSM 43383]|uniref:Uncharacterized protein n=1 Tax=Actinomadura pelletieri DSM 43383 TaxID=1120940 RepID=A0A495QSJ9_9ACTN|nr:hypothetical protein [Actinomadura pelletieri]RKS76480.1 hypothetical protein BZB76_1836 [Actinomadura pelletieri DSM 43383]
MADPTGDPVRDAWKRLRARNAMQFMVPRSVDEPPPVERPDGTVYDGTGQKPTVRDVIDQVDRSA